MKKLNELISCEYDLNIYGITNDSRKVSSGFLFVAVKGLNVDHYDYIKEAWSNGAVAVVTPKKIDLSIPQIIVENPNIEYERICSIFYDKETWNSKLIGITGTDGKTTTAIILQEILKDYAKTAYLGTNGFVCDDKNIPTNNTTPDVEEEYYYLQNANDSNCKYISMEVSSEALLHNRTDKLEYDYTILTNITEDHLNIHKTLDNYINCKKKLFKLLKKDGIAIVNKDDINSCKVLDSINNILYTYGVNEESTYVIKNVILKQKYTYFELLKDEKAYKFRTLLCGMYNIYNLCAAIIVCLNENIPYKYIAKKVSLINNISGRGEVLNFGQKYKLILDYAHTTNGIKNVVIAQKNIKHNKLIVVTGAAGGREKEKRSVIGKYLLDNVDLTIFTMDDPRYENVDKIIDDMLNNTKKTNYLRITDRKKAIYKALDIAKDKDIVLIIGKGRDNYMAILNKKIEYSDYEVIKSYFA